MPDPTPLTSAWLSYRKSIRFAPDFDMNLTISDLEAAFRAGAEINRMDADRYRYLRLAAVPVIGKADIFAGPLKLTVETCLYDRENWATFVDNRVDAARWVDRAVKAERAESPAKEPQP